MRRFSIVNNGYNIDEVNDFIDVVIRKLEKLSIENNDYLKQLEELKNNRDKNVDIKVAKAIVAANETIDRMKELAKEEANLIVKEAKDNASAIVHEALVNAQKQEQEYQLLKKKYNIYKSKIENLAKSQLSLIEDEEEE